MTTKDGTSAGAWVALVLLLLINLFNYIDRQVLSSVEVKIEETFFPEKDFPRDPATRQREDKTIEGKMGALNTAFMVAYMVIAFPFGLLADRMSRWILVGIGVILWSLASGASGLADSYTVMFLTRCLVGVGEAAYGPVAPTVLSDLFPVEKRGKIMSMFYAAIPVGSALGYVLGGQVTAWAGGPEGWRWAFYVVVPPGLLLGVWCLFMKDPPRGQSDPGSVAHQAGWADYWILLKTPSYVLTTIGMTAMTFAMGGMAFWMPRYAVQRQQLHQESLTNIPMDAEEVAELLKHVNFSFGIIVVVSGLAATILGGIAGDRLKPRYPGSYFLVSSIAMAVGFPLILAALWVPFPMAWGFIFAACFCLFFNTGPTNTILANVTHPSIRASAFAVNIFIIHAFGDAISPPIIGLINGYSSMTVGFLTVSFMFLVASAFWFAGIKHLQRDTALAPTRLAP